MATIVIDLDGTLNNCVHRQHHATNGEWDEFHSTLNEDAPYNDVMWFVKLMYEDGIEVIAVTGRNEAYRNQTCEWLSKHKLFGCVDTILMRPENDYTPDHHLKPILLENYIGSKGVVLAEVMVVLDDRDKVVEAWRNYGLPCWQVRPGGY